MYQSQNLLRETPTIILLALNPSDRKQVSRKALTTVRGAFLDHGEAFKPASATDRELAVEAQKSGMRLFGDAPGFRAIFQLKIGMAGLHGDSLLFAARVVA
jgi:hypothetical protein